MEDWDGLEGKRGYKSRGNCPGILEGLYLPLIELQEHDLAERVISHALSRPDYYPLHGVLIPAAQSLAPSLEGRQGNQAGYRRLLDFCLKELVALTESLIPVPKDWAQDQQVSCSCTYCEKLNRFLKNPDAQGCRFPVRKDRRRHLHNQIDAHHCDLSHKTERSGSPYTLVCTKNRKSYEKKVLRFESDTQLLAELRSYADPTT